jgi:hypothetical protein
MTKPILQALVLAEHIYQDAGTGKKIIAGTFNRVFFGRTKPPQPEAPPAKAADGTAPPVGYPAAPQPPSGAVAQGQQSAALPPAPPAPQGPPAQPPAGQPRRLQKTDVLRAGSPFAFISLTDVHGQVPLELRFVDLANGGVLISTTFRVASDDPLATIEAVVPMPPLPTPHAGVYALELLSESEPLGSLRITAIETPPEQQPPA